MLKPLAAAILSFGLALPISFALAPVKDSAEDLYWADPMTVHDYKRRSDLHNIGVSAMAITELEFVRLGDGLINLTTRNKKSPISASIDSLEYAYSKLPRVKPVRRFGQFWDALQLRQLSLSDARLVGSILLGDSVGGITPVMQVRAYKLVVFVEDVIYDLDSAVMFPLNWGVSSLWDKPTKLKSLGYAADGLGVLRWELSAALKYINKKVVRLSSDLIFGVEKVHNLMIRSKKTKLNKKLLVFAKMPLPVFLEHQSYFTGKKKTAFVGTLADWHDRFYREPQLLPDKIWEQNFSTEDLPAQDLSQDVLMAVEFQTWDQTPPGLKKYVIASDELVDFIRQYQPSSPAA